MDGELCPKDTDTESWDGYYYHRTPASLTYFGASAGLFSLLYTILVWLGRGRGRMALRGARPLVLMMRGPPQDRNQLLALRRRVSQRQSFTYTLLWEPKYGFGQNKRKTDSFYFLAFGWSLFERLFTKIRIYDFCIKYNSCASKFY